VAIDDRREDDDDDDDDDWELKKGCPEASERA
jgi:hypothetical protein